jgi:hypothetical protein
MRAIPEEELGTVSTTTDLYDGEATGNGQPGDCQS